MHLDWIDRWKGLLIILVVAGHVFGGACHLCGGISSEFFSFLYKTIYMFHMPAFFWIAGLCWKPRNSSLLLFTIQKTKRLILPYFIFGILSAILYLLIAKDGHLFSASVDNYYQNMEQHSLWQPFVSLLLGNGWPNGEGFRCNSVLWFLPAMFTVLCFYWIIDHFIPKQTFQLLLACLLFIFDFLSRKYCEIILPFGLSSITWLGPFLIFGRWSKKLFDSISFQPSITTSSLLLIMCFLFCLVSWIEPNYSLMWNSFIWFLVFVGMAILGSIISAFIAQDIQWKWLSIFGQSSLGIMLLHKFIVVFLQVKLPLLTYLSQQSTPLFWIGNFIVMLMSLYFSYFITLAIRYYVPWALGEFANSREHQYT